MLVQPTAAEVISSLGKIKKPDRKVRKLKCPHCNYRWVPRAKNPPKCPNCRRDRNPLAKVNKMRSYIKKKVPDLLGANRFTPSTMKQLVDMKYYKYLGVPEGLPRTTPRRDAERKANVLLADRYLLSDLGQNNFGKVYKFRSRAAIFFRLAKGFRIMAERGCFQITAKGREKVAEQKRRAEIAALRPSSVAPEPSDAL